MRACRRRGRRRGVAGAWLCQDDAGASSCWGPCMPRGSIAEKAVIDTDSPSRRRSTGRRAAAAEAARRRTAAPGSEAWARPSGPKGEPERLAGAPVCPAAPRRGRRGGLQEPRGSGGPGRKSVLPNKESRRGAQLRPAGPSGAALLNTRRPHAGPSAARARASALAPPRCRRPQRQRRSVGTAAATAPHVTPLRAHNVRRRRRQRGGASRRSAPRCTASCMTPWTCLRP